MGLIVPVFPQSEPLLPHGVAAFPILFMEDRGCGGDNARCTAAAPEVFVGWVNEWDMVKRRRGHSRQREEDEQK